MKKSLFPDGGVWLKGNIHSHSTVSDGMFSPRELAELYRDHGYAFLSMTDHNVLVSHSELPEDQIILLTGLEHDLEYSPDKCIHVVGIAAAGKEETEYLCKRYSPRRTEGSAPGGPNAGRRAVCFSGTSGLVQNGCGGDFRPGGTPRR